MLAVEDDRVEQDMTILHLAQVPPGFAHQQITQQASSQWDLLRIIHGTCRFLQVLIVYKSLYQLQRLHSVERKTAE
jgi:hypothetical protein